MSTTIDTMVDYRPGVNTVGQRSEAFMPNEGMQTSQLMTE